MSTAVERQVLVGVRRAPGLGARSPARPSAFAVWGLLLFFLLEYLRPPGIVQLKLQLLFVLLVPVLWLRLDPKPWSRNLTFQFLFLLQAALSVFYAANYFSAYLRTRIHFGTFAIALAITWLLAERRNFERTVWFWVGIMSYQAIYSFLHAGRGAGGFIGDENDLALACATVFPFVYAGMLYSKRRVLCLVMAMLYSAAIVFSWSRGGFLGLLAATLYCVLVGRHKVRNIAVGVAAAFVFYLALPASYKAELQTIQETDTGTSEGRFFLWRAATNMWLDHPVQGVGAGNSPWLIGRYQPRETEGNLFNRPMYMKRDWSGTVVHSLYFELLSENGLIGVAIFLCIVYLHFTTLHRLRRDITRDSRASPELKRKVDLYVTGLAGAGVAYLVAGAFLAVLYYPYLWYFSAMAVALDRWVRSELDAAAPAPAKA